MDTITSEKRKITVGLPVYNGEKFLQNRLDSILTQTYADFELIISDNNSIDKTNEICSNYAKKDFRIKYFKQDENIGVEKNFKFVLDQARYDFFVWVGVDDIWEDTFLEKNIENILNHDELVGSVSNVVQYGENLRRTGSDFRKLANKINSKFSKYGSHPIKGSYNLKIRECLKKNSGQNIYGIFRTKELKNSCQKIEYNSASDLCIILKVLKYGEIGIVKENLLKCTITGMSGQGKIETTIKKYGEKSIILPHYTFMKWFITNFGTILFLKNFDLMFKMNLGGFLAVIYDLIIKKN
jgi:glycosyltransferase involved in cell wall biosynthesis